MRVPPAIRSPYFAIASAIVSTLMTTGMMIRQGGASPRPPAHFPAEQTATPPAGHNDNQELRRLHVNEAGKVPILEYHEIATAPGHSSRATRMMHRTVAEFRADLERLYKEGYRPINLSEFLNNRIDLPLGLSPVILTFDDARGSQFRYLSDGNTDPKCAVGILQEFNRLHPDWPLKGTFYVLPEGAFGSEHYAAQKMRALVQMGFELGNHTRTHNYFNRMSNASIIKEIAQGKSITEKMTPGVNLDTLALPGGCTPRSHDYTILQTGEYLGTRYNNRAVLNAWGGPAPAPLSKRYDPLRIPRVLCVNGGGGINEALDELKSPSGGRYVSDGDPNIFTIPQRLASTVDRSRLNNLPLRTYDDGVGTSKAKPTPKNKTSKKKTSSKLQ